MSSDAASRLDVANGLSDDLTVVTAAMRGPRAMRVGRVPRTVVED